jgi:hypothetical protein
LSRRCAIDTTDFATRRAGHHGHRGSLKGTAMHESHARRRLVGSAIAGAAALGAALNEIRSVSAAPARTAGAVQKRFRGRIHTLDIRRNPNGEKHWYQAKVVLKHNGGDLKENGSGGEVHDLRLYRMLHRRNGQALQGQISVRVKGVNYRLMGAEFDKTTHIWVLDLKLCASNPDADPLKQVALPDGTLRDYRVDDSVSGCSCDCLSSCWHCAYENKGQIVTRYKCSAYSDVSPC